MSAFLRLSHIVKTYPLGQDKVYALKDVSLSVERGELLSIVGHSGSGKSTLMNILGCLDTADSGSYLLDGEEMLDKTESQRAVIRGEKIGFIFQGFHLIQTLTAVENVELPLLYRGVTQARRRKQAQALLASVGLEKRADHLPNQLSGGQQQRVAVARALAADPPLILADEPTGNLDRASAREVVRILTGLKQRGATVIMITHDTALAAVGDRQVAIEDGRIV